MSLQENPEKVNSGNFTAPGQRRDTRAAAAPELECWSRDRCDECIAAVDKVCCRFCVRSLGAFDEGEGVNGGPAVVADAAEASDLGFVSPFTGYGGKVGGDVHRSVGAGAEGLHPSRRPGSVPACGHPSISEAYAEWLREFDDMWAWYAHFTFRPGAAKSGSVHPERADVLFRRWLDLINRRIWGRNYKRSSTKGVLVTRSTEIGSKGGLLHYHALLGRVPADLRRVEWKEEWNEIAGFARIHAYDRSLGGAAYLSKSAYAWKRGEIDFIGPWDKVGAILGDSYGIPELFRCRQAEG